MIVLKKSFRNSIQQRGSSEDRGQGGNCENHNLKNFQAIFSPQNDKRKQQVNYGFQESIGVENGRNKGLSSILMSPSNHSSKYMELKSVKDILFTHVTHASRKEQQNNQSLVKKIFKKFKKYVKLKLQVKAFLSDELNTLNQEFQNLQKSNILLKEKYNQLKYQKTSKNHTLIRNQLISKIELQRRQSLLKRIFYHFKILQKSKAKLKSIFKSQFKKSLSKYFHFWDKQSVSIKSISFYLHKSQNTTQVSRHASPFIKGNKMNNCINATSSNTKFQGSLFTNSIKKESLGNKDSIKMSQSTPQQDLTKGSKSIDSTKSRQMFGSQNYNSIQKNQQECFQEYYNKRVNDRISQQHKFFDERFIQKLQRLKELEKQVGLNQIHHYDIQEEEMQLKRSQYSGSLSHSGGSKEYDYSDNQQAVSQFMGYLNQQQITAINPDDQSSAFLHSNRGDYFMNHFEKDSTQSSKNILAILENLNQNRISSQNMLIEEKEQLEQKHSSRLQKQSKEFLFTPGFGDDQYAQRKNQERIIQELEEIAQIDQTKVNLYDIFNPGEARDRNSVKNQYKRTRYENTGSYFSEDVSFHNQRKQQLNHKQKKSLKTFKKKFQDENLDPNLQQQKRKELCQLEKLRF